MGWWYADGDQRRGPLTEFEFDVLVENGTVRPSTLVWRDGLPEWVSYGQLATPGIPVKSGAPMRFAGFWIRFVAKFVDGFILSVPTTLIQVPSMMSAMLTGDPESLDRVYTLSVYLSVAFLPVQMLYFILFVGAKGATPGKMLLGLRVVRADGAPVGYALATGRYFAAALNYLTLYIGWIMAGFDGQKRGLHDFICDTRVVHTR